MDKTPGPAPVYLLAGGRGSRRKDGDPLLQRILASCGVPRPSVAYIGAASNDDRAFFMMLSGYMRLAGAGRVTRAPLANKRASLDRSQAIIESADMVYISGGDVEAGMKVLEQREILPFLRGLYKAGKPFFGISAGSIMLAQQWVRWADPDDDATASTFPCMGFAPLLCDTHGEKEGWEELRALLTLTPPGSLGYGLPSGSGVCVHPDGTVEAMGVPLHRYVNRDGEVTRIADLPPPKR